MGPAAAMPTPRAMSRRSLLLRAGGALAGAWLPGTAFAATPAVDDPSQPSTLAPIYIAIAKDGKVTIQVPATEIGQGVTTSLCQIVAEELDADWATVGYRLAGAGEVFANPGKGYQAVGRSMSIRGYFPLLRRVGATARARLVQAAATRWSVEPEQVRADKGVLIGPGGKRLTFGEVAEAAAAGPMPTRIALKDPAKFTLIGASPARLDLPPKVDGSAIYGIDLKVEGMLTAAIATCPEVGGGLGAIDEAAAAACPGVRKVVRTTQGLAPGVAVCADRYWQAVTGLRAAAPKWSSGPNAALSSDILQKQRRAALAQPGFIAAERGDLAAAFAGAAKVVEGAYEAPFLAHAPMEPMTCLADVKADSCILWVAAQGQMRARDAVAKFLGIGSDKVTVHTVQAGGGFGRRWQIDYVLQAAELSKACGRPVKLVWSREEDFAHDWFRPAVSMHFRAALTAKGELAGLEMGVAGDSLMEWGKPRPAKPALDATSASGISDHPYAGLAAFRSTSVTTPSPVPIGMWRSVGHSQNIFFLEGALNEIAVAAGADPVAFRRKLLGKQPRMLRVLDAAAKMANWGRAKRPKEGRGVALCEAYGSVVAQVIDVTRSGDGLRLDSVFCAIDCGRAVSPDGVRQQMEGGILFALSAAATGDITFDKGRPSAATFSDNMPLMLGQSPKIQVVLLDSDAPIGGAGEPGVPCVAPALLEALADAGGPRLRELPLARAGIGV